MVNDTPQISGTDTDADGLDLLQDPEERKVMYNAVNSFHRYRDQAHYHITHKRRQAFYALPQMHWQMLSGAPFSVLDHLEKVDEAIDKNAEISEAFVESGVLLYDLAPPPGQQGYSHAENSTQSADWQLPVNPTDQEKAHSTVKQLYRDWSAEGASEREACYGPVLRALDVEFLRVPKSQRGTIKILVPGAGLGRFVYEVNHAGYAVQGNEISYHQIIASNFMLNWTSKAEQFELYPWIHSFSNHLSREKHLQKVLIPDVHPGTELRKVAEEFEIHPFERMAFASGDFCVTYKGDHNKEIFDAVTTIFFIDTAPNVIKYIEAVHNCLQTGGVWINLGPLKWHFENNLPSDEKKENKPRSQSSLASDLEDQGIGDPGSFELTENEVILLIERFGFRVEKHEVQKIATRYIGDPHSMWQGFYYPSFWIARKL